jgi:hypothetical protein
MMNVLLIRSRPGTVPRKSAPHAETRGRRQSPAAGTARVRQVGGIVDRGQILCDGRAPRHSLDGFYRRRYRIGIWLWPTEIGRKALKKIFDLLASGRFFVRFDWLVFVAHGNLIAIYCRRIRSFVDAESYAHFRIGGHAVTERRAVPPTTHCAQYRGIFIAASTVKHEGTVHASVGTNHKTDSHQRTIGRNRQ